MKIVADKTKKFLEPCSTLRGSFIVYRQVEAMAFRNLLLILGSS